MYFSQLVKQRMEEKGWGTAKLAKATGISQRYIQYIVSGRYGDINSRPMMGIKIALVLEIPIKQLRKLCKANELA
jgi:transcriptional regulator with XRE-family HTH domain